MLRPFRFTTGIIDVLSPLILPAKRFDFGVELSLPGFFGFLLLLGQTRLSVLGHGAQYLRGFLFLSSVDFCRVATVELFVGAVHHSRYRPLARFYVNVALDAASAFSSYLELPMGTIFILHWIRKLNVPDATLVVDIIQLIDDVLESRATLFSLAEGVDDILKLVRIAFSNPLDD